MGASPLREGSAMKTVVITGTSTGIGRSTALVLDREGWRVFAGVRRDEDGEHLQKEASARLNAIHLDVTDPLSIASSARQVSEAVGDTGLDGLVNNAGIGFGGPIEFTDLDRMRAGYEVNVFGPIAVSQAFLPLLRRGGANARIVNVSSAAGKLTTPLIGPYCSSKFALEAISDAMRIELRSFGIKVAVIEPGFIDTPMQTKAQTQLPEEAAELGEAGQRYYGAALEKVQALFVRFAKTAAPPEKVARQILRGLTAPRPRARYTAGPDAKLMSLLNRILPDRAKDAILGRMVGL